MALPPKVYQFLVGVFASLGSWLFGYDLVHLQFYVKELTILTKCVQGVIAEVIASGSFKAIFNKPSDVDTGLIVSLFTAGAFVGSFLVAEVGDRLGRRLAIVSGTIIFCVGGALQTGASNISYLWGGRFLAGTGSVISVHLMKAKR